MKYIVFDLEWNQAADVTAIVQDPVYLTGEIVQIGAVKLDEYFHPVDELRLFIAPQYYTKMHRSVATLTGIRDKDLAEKGISFPEAYQQLSEWCGNTYAFMTWSMNDIPMLIDNMILHGIDTSNLPECYDLQRIFSREIMRSETRYSLDTALALLKEKGYSAHDALHDARNTAKICDHLDLEVYLGEYTTRVFPEHPSRKLYESQRQLMSDPSLSEFCCPRCGKSIKSEDWIPLGGNTYIAYGTCPDGDEFLVQLSYVCHRKNEYLAKRIFLEMSDDLWDTYVDKKDLLGV